MKKVFKVLLLSLSLFTTIKLTSAYFTTSTNTISIVNTKGYEIIINANGGSFNSSSILVSHNLVTLPEPYKTGYSFLGYSDTPAGNVNYSIDEVKIDDINSNGIYAIWSKNSYTIDINPAIDGIIYNSGLDGFTFDVWVNDILVADDVIDFYQSVEYGSNVRVKTNNAIGRNTSYDETITVGTNAISLNPDWATNTYESKFYLNNNYITSTYNKYGSTISTPNLSAGSLGYDSSFYYLSGYSAWTTWTQPDYSVGFSINIAEYNCHATFGTAGVSNANAQLTKLQNAGYKICYVSGNGIVCSANYSSVIALYNNAWNILPRSGSGYSIYKSMSCDSGFGIEARR